jgi:hypothetical protein
LKLPPIAQSDEKNFQTSSGTHEQGQVLEQLLGGLAQVL